MYAGKGGREIFLIFFYTHTHSLPFELSSFCAKFVAMNQYLLKFIAAAILTLLTACSGSEQFRINGVIDGFGTGNLRVVYQSAGAIRSVTATAVDGKFMVLANIANPAIVRVYTGQGNLLGRLIIEPGQTVDLRLNAADPADITAQGNKDTERLAAFLKENAPAFRTHDTAAINKAVEQCVRKNPNWLLSGLLISEYYDPRGNENLALELLASLDPEVIRYFELSSLRELLAPLSHPVDSLEIPVEFPLFSQSDTLHNVSLRSSATNLIMVTTAQQRKADSISAALSVLTPQRSRAQLAIIDISADRDTASWHTSLRNLPDADNNTIISRYWSPAPYNMPALKDVAPATTPWFIVADSTGAVLYRGASLTAARNAIPDTAGKSPAHNDTPTSQHTTPQ